MAILPPTLKLNLEVQTPNLVEVVAYDTKSGCYRLVRPSQAVARNLRTGEPMRDVRAVDLFEEWVEVLDRDSMGKLQVDRKANRVKTKVIRGRFRLEVKPEAACDEQTKRGQR
jgi:hypothetical protein